jgi:hypothetical protein
MFGPAFVAGVHEVNRRMDSTGNEHGFWVTGTGDQTQIHNWGDGSEQSISAAYNPNARFHVHTHPNNTGPSHADMFASAVLGGMPGLVVAANWGQFAYGFQLEAGILKTHNGMVVFEQTYNGPGGNLETMNGYDFYGSIDHSGTVGVGSGFGATYGKGVDANVSYVQSTNENGIITGRAVQTTVLTMAGFNLFSGTPTVTFGPQTTFVDGTVPVVSLTVSTPIGTASGTISLDNPGDYSIGLSRPGFGATIGVGTQTTTNSSFSGCCEGAPAGTTYSDYNSGQWWRKWPNRASFNLYLYRNSYFHLLNKFKISPYDKFHHHVHCYFLDFKFYWKLFRQQVAWNIKNNRSWKI